MLSMQPQKVVSSLFFSVSNKLYLIKNNNRNRGEENSFAKESMKNKTKWQAPTILDYLFKEIS